MPKSGSSNRTTPKSDPLEQATTAPPKTKKKCAKELFPDTKNAEENKAERYANRWTAGKAAGFDVSDLAQSLNAPVPLNYRKVKWNGKKAKAAVEWRLASLRMTVSNTYTDNANGNCVFESGECYTSVHVHNSPRL